MLGFLKKKKAETQVKVKFTDRIANATDEQNISQENTDNDFVNVNCLNTYLQPKSAPENTEATYRDFGYDIGICNPASKFKQLFSEGYLKEANKADTLATYKQSELKEVLAANNLPTTGRKNSELLDRILSSLDVDSLEIPVKYVVSTKGQEFIDQNQDLLKFYTDSRRFKMSYEQYASKKAAAPYMKYNDIIWSIFNERELTFTSNLEREYNARFKAIFLEEEGRFVDALSQYIYVLYYNVNDVAYKDLMIASSSKNKKKYEAYEYSPDKSLNQKLFDLKENYTEKMLDRCYPAEVELNAPIKRKDFKRLLFDIFEGKEIELKNYY